MPKKNKDSRWKPMFSMHDCYLDYCAQYPTEGGKGALHILHKDKLICLKGIYYKSVNGKEIITIDNDDENVELVESVEADGTPVIEIKMKPGFNAATSTTVNGTLMENVADTKPVGAMENVADTKPVGAMKNVTVPPNTAKPKKHSSGKRGRSRKK